MEDPTKHEAQLEALLFIHGEPISLKKICSVLSLSEEEARSAIANLRDALGASGRGLSLIEEGEKIQLVTKKEYAHILETFVKEDISGDLSPAAVETLAIICYFGPISKSRIEYLRGVNSSFILRNLSIRGLVEKSQYPAQPATVLYCASFDLLRHFGIEKKTDLPDFEKYKQMLQRMEEGKDAAEESQNPDTSRQ